MNLFLYKNKQVLTYLGFSLLSVYLCLTIPFPKESVKYVPFLTLLALVQVGCWYYFTRKERDGNVYHPIIIFCLSYLIIYFQNPFLKSLGFYVGALETNPRFGVYTEHGAALALMGLSFFFLGYFVFAKKYRPIYSKMMSKRLRIESWPPEFFGKASRYVAILVFIPIILFYITSGRSYLHGHYSNDLIDSASLFGTIMERMAQVFLYIAILFQHFHLIRNDSYSIRKIFWKFDRVVLFAVITFLAPLIYVGDRGNVLIMGALLIGPYFLISQRLKAWQLLVVILCLGSVLTLIGAGRHGYLATWLKNIKKSGNIEYLIPTRELAGSNRANNIALYQNYEGQLPPNYFTGRYTIMGVLHFIIPGSFHFVKYYKGDSFAFEDYSVAHLITYLYYGRKEVPGGLGSTSLASIVIDFGAWSIPLFLFLFGGGMRKLEEYTFRNGNIYTFTMCSIMCYMGLYINRTDPWLILARLLFTVAMMFLFIQLVRHLSPKISYYSKIVGDYLQPFYVYAYQFIRERLQQILPQIYPIPTTALYRMRWVSTIFVACLIIHVLSDGLRINKEDRNNTDSKIVNTKTANTIPAQEKSVSVQEKSVEKVPQNIKPEIQQVKTLVKPKIETTPIVNKVLDTAAIKTVLPKNDKESLLKTVLGQVSNKISDIPKTQPVSSAENITPLSQISVAKSDIQPTDAAKNTVVKTDSVVLQSNGISSTENTTPLSRILVAKSDAQPTTVVENTGLKTKSLVLQPNGTSSEKNIAASPETLSVKINSQQMKKEENKVSTTQKTNYVPRNQRNSFWGPRRVFVNRY